MPSVHPTNRRAVAYYRCSTGQQEASIPEQKDWCRTAAQRESIDIAYEDEDEGISGSEMERRPGLMRVAAWMEAQTANPPTVLICWDADRLSRATSTRTAAFLDRMMEAGITHILTSDGWVDLEDESDLIVFNIRQDSGRAAYSRSIAKNVTRNAIDHAKAGQWVAGKTPYAYRLGDDGRLVPHEGEAEVVRLIYRRVIAGDSLGDICRDLVASQVTPPTPAKRQGATPRWRRGMVHSIATSRVYAGDIVWNQTHQGKHQRIKSGRGVKATGQRGRATHEVNPADDLIIVEGAHPAIIDRGTFAAAAAALASRRWKRTAPTLNNEWIFSGMLYCGDCGAKMYGRAKTYRRKEKSYTYRMYRCSANATSGGGICQNTSALQDAVLAAVLGELKAIYADPGRLERLDGEVAAVASSAQANYTAELRRIEDALADIDRRIVEGEQRLLILPPQHIAGVSRLIDEMRSQREALAASRAALLATATATQTDAGVIRDALAALGAIEDVIADVPAREARRVVERLVTKVTVVFDHTRPSNKTHAASVDIEFHPDIANLLSSGPRRRPPSAPRLR